MSTYVEGALVKDEALVHVGHISLWSLWHLIAAGIVLLPLFGVGLIFLAVAYVRYKSFELGVTTKRVIVKRGFRGLDSYSSSPTRSDARWYSAVASARSIWFVRK
ncbi:MAG: hypothetical protein U1F67_13995 [Rubrivivax sp.]